MKHEKLISEMSIEEKAAFLSGKTVWKTRAISRLGIPSIFLADGPHGIRKQAGAGDHLGLNESLKATCFPTAATVANSWNEELGQEIGRALGQEARQQEVHILLGPGLNIKRSPLCGRNFEYFSEDPYLSGKMAAAYIKGIQNQGVYACPKHLAVNSQELRRMAMSSILDERTYREIYLTGFEIAVKEGGARTIMSSYNEINGVYANENPHLLKEILRDEWGFDGIVITDWGGSNNHEAGVAAGSNLEMPAPGLDSARELIAAVNEGRLKEEDIDARTDELLDIVLHFKDNQKAATEVNEKQHHDLARKAAHESIVLLKNIDDILPLGTDMKVGVIGDFAIEPRYQGAGSSMVNPFQVENIAGIVETYFPNYTGYVKGYNRNGEKDEALHKAALDLAGISDVVLFCFGLDEMSEVEGMDRNHMRVPQNQIDLLKALVQENPNIIGVLSAGSAIEVPWHYCCKGILHGYLGGQAGASAMLDVITGKINPSGRLSETYPLRYEDTPAFRYFPGQQRNSEYREGPFVGYRYYDTSQVRIQYPFGYGLSYTSFEYSDLEISEFEVSFYLKNTGDMDGAEVAQLYVGCPSSRIFRPAKELKGFKKIYLKAGEKKKIIIPFDDKTFRYWNVRTNQWEIESGTYAIQIGTCVLDIKLNGSIEVAGTTEVFPYDKEKMPSYFSGLVQDVQDHEFEQLLGYAIPEDRWSGELGANDTISQMYYAKSRIARFIYKRLNAIKEKSEEKGKPDLNILFIYSMPFRAIAKMTNGLVSMEMVRGIVLVINGSFFKGMKKIIGGYFANRRANRIYEKKLVEKKKKG